MKRYFVKRLNDTVEVLLLPHKDGSGFSFVNMTKGHICSCKFKTIEDALNDMKNDPYVVSFEEVIK